MNLESDVTYSIKEYKYGKLAFINESDKSYFFKENSTYQEYINDEFKKNYRPKSNILDVGSNVGIFSVSFANIAKDCTIHSFEAVKITRELLEVSKNLSQADNIKIYDFGLSEKNCTSIINIDPNRLGNSSISQDFSNLDGAIKEEINLKKLDDLKLNNISFIKVDIQEHEYEFLHGAVETLKNNDAVIILEIPLRNPHEIKIHKKCVKLLKKLGYIYMRRCINASKDYIFSKNKL